MMIYKKYIFYYINLDYIIFDYLTTKSYKNGGFDWPVTITENLANQIIKN